MNRALLAILLCLSLVSAAQSQEVITARRRVSTPAGTAPVIIGFSSAIACVGTGGGCSFFVTVSNVGDTILWSIVDGQGNTAAAPASSNGETITCTAYHNFLITGTSGGGNAETRICHFLSSTTGSYTITNPNNQGTATNAGIILEIQCQESPSAQCVLDQLAYQDTTGTLLAGTSTAGLIITTHQLDELIIGGFFVGQWNGDDSFNGSATQVAPYVNCPAEINPACMKISSFGGSYAFLERYNAIATGTFQATATWAKLGNTAGFTLSIY